MNSKFADTSPRATTNEPVYIKASHVPKSKTSYDMCEALEHSMGKGSILCSQVYGGLWEITLNHARARVKLLARGAVLWGQSVPTYDKNPFLHWDEDGNEIPTTKLFIENLPFSVRNDDIEVALKGLGVEMFSPIRMENASDGKGNRHDRWLTGRRFVKIKTPSQPLTDHMMVGKTNVKLYHKEQRQAIPCKNCLKPGHRAANCPNEMVCLDCKKPGHKRGDRVCDLVAQKEICVDCGKGGHLSALNRACDLYKDDFPDCTDCGKIGHVSGDPLCKQLEELDFLREWRNGLGLGRKKATKRTIKQASIDIDSDSDPDSAEDRLRDSDDDMGDKETKLREVESQIEWADKCVRGTILMARVAEGDDWIEIVRSQESSCYEYYDAYPSDHDDVLCCNAAEAMEALAIADEADAEAAERAADKADADKALESAEAANASNTTTNHNENKSEEDISNANEEVKSKVNKIIKETGNKDRGRSPIKRIPTLKLDARNISNSSSRSPSKRRAVSNKK